MPVSAYGAIATLSQRGTIAAQDQLAWNAIVGLCDRIVHDYINNDMEKVWEVVRAGRYELITRFLLELLLSTDTQREFS